MSKHERNDEFHTKTGYLWIIRYKALDLRLAFRQEVLAPSLVFVTLPAYCTVILCFSTNTLDVEQFATFALVVQQSQKTYPTMKK
jgi:hypothetical protein